MQGLLIDIMLNGRFHCQMRYPHRPWVKIVDGEGVPTYDIRDLERYVFEKRPWLRGKDICIIPTTQRLIRR